VQADLVAAAGGGPDVEARPAVGGAHDLVARPGLAPVDRRVDAPATRGRAALDHRGVALLAPLLFKGGGEGAGARGRAAEAEDAAGVDVEALVHAQPAAERAHHVGAAPGAVGVRQPARGLVDDEQVGVGVQDARGLARDGVAVPLAGLEARGAFRHVERL
jgi:hypothetical protein